MNIRIITVGKLKEKYLVDAVEEYKKRLGAFCKIELIEVKDYAVGDILKMEEQEILKYISNYYIISLCVEGHMLSSEDLASKVDEVATYKNSNVCFIIGGSFGLSDKIKELSDFKLSFSKMTFPHQLMKVILLEQIYRSFKINNNQSYHK